jgi:hypothetical protein
MPTKLSTTIKQITTAVANPINSTLISDFYQYMKSNGASERHQNNNLKAIIAFGKFIGPIITFYDIKRREDIVAFLNTKIKHHEQDPDKKWIITWKYFTESVSLIVVDRGTGGKRYTCTLREFTDLSYDELIAQKTGFKEYMDMRKKKHDLN